MSLHAPHSTHRGHGGLALLVIAGLLLGLPRTAPAQSAGNPRGTTAPTGSQAAKPPATRPPADAAGATDHGPLGSDKGPAAARGGSTRSPSTGTDGGLAPSSGEAGARSPAPPPAGASGAGSKPAGPVQDGRRTPSRSP